MKRKRKKPNYTQAINRDVALVLAYIIAMVLLVRSVIFIMNYFNLINN